MATPTEPIKTSTEAAPESPTTARPLEMDDDDVPQEMGVLGEAGTPKPAATPTTSAPPATTDDTPAPPKPARPLTEQQKNEQILREAFPTVDATVVKAVLSASLGQIEPAFNALLEMSDPDAVRHDEQPPPQPPRPAAQPPAGPTATPRSQMEADELYARQLAEQFDNHGAYEDRTSNRGAPPSAWSRPRQQTGLKPNEMYDKDHSFVEDDLPVIKENLRKGFQESQATVNRWFSNIKKKFDETFDDEEGGEGSEQPRPYQGRPNRDNTRRSGDYDRYDADPELLSDDFAGMKFNADGTPASGRPLANPNLFKPPPPSKSPKPSDGRKVAFKEGAEDIDAYDASSKLPPKDVPPTAAAGGKQSKWQPLSTVDPSPIADNDPFSLGDSDDEKEHKASGGGIKLEDSESERLRAAAAEAMADSLVEDKPKTEAAGPTKE